MNRYLARSGVASRREADRLIAQGVVLVNGRCPAPTGTLIDPARDVVTVHGHPIEPAPGHRWLVLNKPAGIVTTGRDPQGRTTVFDLLPLEHRRRRLFCVGRLDRDTTGLLLLTDEGELANRLMHPRHKVPKEYLATVKGVPSERTLRTLRAGVELEDGVTLPAEVELLAAGGGRARLRLVLREGRNRQVRRMLAAVGHPVLELERTAVGPVRLGRLRPGGWRRLRPRELEELRRAVGLSR